MKLTTLLAVLLLSLVATALPSSAAMVESEQRFFLRGEGCGASEDPYLSVLDGSDGLDGCGGIGGLPFNEVFHHTLGASPTTFAARDGLGFVLNPEGQIEVTIRSEQWISGTVTAGQSIVDVTLSGNQDGSFIPVVLGSGSSEVIVTPLDGDGVEHTFTFDVPANVSAAPFTGFSIDVEVRGANQNGSNLGLEGDSHITLPILVEDGS